MSCSIKEGSGAAIGADDAAGLWPGQDAGGGREVRSFLGEEDRLVVHSAVQDVKNLPPLVLDAIEIRIAA